MPLYLQGTGSLPYAHTRYDMTGGKSGADVNEVTGRHRILPLND